MEEQNIFLNQKEILKNQININMIRKKEIKEFYNSKHKIC